MNSLIKIGVETQEHLPTKQILPLNTEKVELQEPNDKPDLRTIKEEIETEPGMAQELLQSVAKGKGNGVDNRDLIDVNEIIRYHPVEMIGYELRESMTDMKKII